MKHTRLSFIILIIFFALNGCQSKKENANILCFDLINLPENKEVTLSDLNCYNVTYVPLESKRQSLISNIMDIKFGNEFFLIQSFNTIYMFSDNGSFKRKIGTEGRGPNEITHIHDFDIDKRNQDIFLVSAWQKKFFVYSKDGEFKRTFQCPGPTTSFKISREGILCYNINSFANIDSSYRLIDNNGLVIKSYRNSFYWTLTQSSTAIFNHENLFYCYNDRVFKKEVYSDTIYEYHELNFKPHIVIEAGNRLLTTHARSIYNSEYLFKNYINPNNLFEVSDYIFYEFNIDFKIGGMNYSNYFIGSKIDKYKTLLSEENGLINDLDGGPNIWPKTTKDDNTLVAWIDAIRLKNHVASDAFKNSKPKYPEKKKELERLANSLKETDNPILILVRLKK